MAHSPAAATDRLAPYRGKRDFARTREPEGVGSALATWRPRGSWCSVTARAGRRYDVRLEIDGVPASWAAPKGPTLDPKVRRAAFHVEDHPLEYFDFEGVIPTGRYGGGDVIVWDAGTWEPHEAPDPGRAVADGGLHLDLYGDKLRGRFILVRTRTNSSGKEEWLLPHKHDEYALKAPVVDAPSKQNWPGSMLLRRAACGRFSAATCG